MNEEVRFTEEELNKAREILDEKLKGKMELTLENLKWWIEEE